MTAPGPLVAVYADESCLGNGKAGATPGGAGLLLELPRADGVIVRRDLWIAEPDTTNNRMAIRSAIEALTALSAKGQRCRVVFTSDSRYLIDGMREWVHGWVRRGWRKADKQPVENAALWQAAIRAAAQHEVAWQWVRGHNGHPQNEYVNHLATTAAARQDASGGLVPSQYETWHTAYTATGKRIGAPSPLPTADAFRPDRPMPTL